jgi:hypothetical protein
MKKTCICDTVSSSSTICNCDDEVISNLTESVKSKKFFDLWSRKDDETLTTAILRRLGASIPESTEILSMAFFDSCPQPDYSNDNFDTVLLKSQVRALFSKNEDLDYGIDKDAVAYSSFLQSEQSCKVVNDRLRAYASNLIGVSQIEGEILHYAKRKIAYILGDCPNVEDLNLSYGPGAAVNCKSRTTARWKLNSVPSISPSTLPIMPEIIRTLPQLFNFHKKFHIVAAELEFVPKNFKTSRAICIEPSISGMGQRGIGNLLKGKLKRNGIDLSNQSINKNRALHGSINDDLATIDLERASDSLPYGLVLELLPISWFNLLDSFRSPVVSYKGTNLILEKFSSMGNGYTFELESLIFYALASGISECFELPNDVTVYGDDIVCGSALAQKICEYFPCFGFSVNIEKSFLQGPFRESCGGDYLLGMDVRPFYKRQRASFSQVFSFYNFLMRKPWFDDERKVRNFLLSIVPANYLLFGPDGYGDGHLISAADLRTYARPHGREKGWCGFIFKTIVSSPYRDTTECEGDVLLPSYVSMMTQPPLFSSYLGRFSSIRIDALELGPISETIDHYTLRLPRNARNKSRIVNIYVLNPDT